jgi:hypothetical protein
LATIKQGDLSFDGLILNQQGTNLPCGHLTIHLANLRHQTLMAAGFTTFIDMLSHPTADIDTFSDVQERAARIEKSIDTATPGQRLGGGPRSGNREGLSHYGDAVFSFFSGHTVSGWSSCGAWFDGRLHRYLTPDSCLSEEAARLR